MAIVIWLAFNGNLKNKQNNPSMESKDYSLQFQYYCTNILHSWSLARVRAINYYCNGVMNH